MAGTANVRTDSSTLSAIDQGLYRVERWLALVSGIAVLSLMVLAVYSVGGRNMFNSPMPGYVDWIEQVLPLIAFMGVSYTQRDGGHIRMDMLVGTLRGRALWTAELITVSVMLLLMILMVWGSWAHFDRSFDFAAPLWSRDSTMDIALPIWPAKLLAPIAFFILCIRLALQVWCYGRALINNEIEPIAVPLIEDVATQAAREAEQVSGGD